MAMDIYELATRLQEKYNEQYPASFALWTQLRLDHFDNTEVGTKFSLKERRREYEEELKFSHKLYVDAMRRDQEKTMTHLREALAQEFFSYPGQGITIPTKVSDRVFDRAYDAGHSSGFRDVVVEYNSLAEFVFFVLRDFREEEKYGI